MLYDANDKMREEIVFQCVGDKFPCVRLTSTRLWMERMTMKRETRRIDVGDFMSMRSGQEVFRTST